MRHHDPDIEALREQVDCRSVLERAGWRMDRKESTRRAVKYRRGAGEIIIVTHEGRGWFDPLSPAKGDVFSLAQHLWGGSFSAARRMLRPLAGVVPAATPFTRARPAADLMPLRQRWYRRPRPRPGSPCWVYLTSARGLPNAALHRVIAADVLREGPFGSLWALHRNAEGQVSGWEMRGPHWRGFATGGHKTLFVVGDRAPTRIVVAEAAIDALSLAALEGFQPGSRYASTGGGIGPATGRLLAATGAAVEIVAATDADDAGDRHAERIGRIAASAGARFSRLRPSRTDWNDVLRKGEFG